MSSLYKVPVKEILYSDVVATSPAKLKESAYISLVRFTLECAAPVWDLHLEEIGKIC